MILKQARRFLRRNPLLNVLVIALLALGLAAFTFAFTLLLLFSSPSSPGMRFMRDATIAEQTSGGGAQPFAWDKFEKLRGSLRRDIHLAAYSKSVDATLRVNEQDRRLQIAVASGGFFSVLTDPLSYGRDFRRVEEEEAGRHVVILSYSLAASLFTTPATALNQYVELNGFAFQVTGVAPRGFQGIFGSSAEAWVPANCMNPLYLNLSNAETKSNPDLWKTIPGFYGVVGSNAASTSDLLRSLTRTIRALGNEGTPLSVHQGLSSDPVRDAKLRRWSRLGLLLAFVFMLATGLNYCGLLLARAPLYLEEIRLRRTLGAGTWRLMTELVAGPAMTVSISFLASFLLLAGGLFEISQLSIFQQVLRGSWHIALQALGIQILLAGTLTFVIALTPALRLLRDSGAPKLGYTSTRNKRTSTVLQSIVVLQMVSCITACILASMIISAVQSMMREPLGYRPGALSAVRVLPPHGRSFGFSTSSEGQFPLASTMQGAIEQASSLPGVRSVSAALNAPFDQPMKVLTLQRSNVQAASSHAVNYTAVTQGYFRTLGNRLIQGKSFSSDKLTGEVTEIVINQALKEELWPHEDPINQPVKLIAPGSGIVFTASVTGVAEDMHFSRVTATAEPTVFLPLRGLAFTMGMPFYIITDGSESLRSLQDRVNKQLAAQMPTLSAQHAYNIGGEVKASLQVEQQREYLSMGTVLSIALVAYIGLYGALAHYVSTRRRELAVRMCFGASSWTIRKTVMRQAAQCGLMATALSIPIWPALAHLSSSEWLGRFSWSSWLAALVALACVATSILISVAPAIAATRVSVVDALKDQ